MLRIAIAILATVALTVGVLLLGVKLIPEDVLRARFVQEAQQVVGRSLVVGGSTTLALLPAPRLVVDEVVMTEGGPRITVDRTVVTLAPWARLSGEPLVGEVRLEGLRVSAEAGDGAVLLGLLPDLDLPDRLVLTNGRLILREDGEGRVRVSDVALSYARQPDGRATLDGTARVNGLDVTLASVVDRAALPEGVGGAVGTPAVGGTLAGGAAMETVPIDLMVTAPDLRLAWRGGVGVAEEAGRIVDWRLDGEVSVLVRQPGEVARRFGVDRVAADGLGAIEVAGRIARSHDRLSFDGLAVALGETRADLSLTVLGGGSVRDVSGSVFWQRLDLTAMATAWGALPSDWWAASALPETLRGELAVVADAVTLGRRTLGALDATVALAPRSVEAMVGRLSLGGGSLVGDLAWRLPGADPRAEPGSLRANALATRIDLDRLWRDLAVPVSLSGVLSGEAAVSLPLPVAPAHGTVGVVPGDAVPWQDALSQVTGRGDVRLGDARFMVPGAAIGSDASRRAAVQLDQIDARLSVADGRVRLQPITVRAGRLDLQGGGEIDLGDFTLAVDLESADLESADVVTPTPGAAPIPEDPVAEALAALGLSAGRLRIQGPLQAPYIGPAEGVDLPAGGGDPLSAD